MKLIEILQNVADGAILLQWLLIGYLFYLINPDIAIILILAFIVGTVCKVFILREEEKAEQLFIMSIKERIEKENELYEKSFDKNSDE